MPEKSKRRKNNKNKRKNKFSRVDANSNNNATNNVSDLLSPENIKEEKESDSKIYENKCTVEKKLLQNASIENDKDTKNKDENVTDSETDKIKTNKFLENVSTPVDTSTGEPLNVYIVEAPGQSYKAKSKLSNGKKSKSVDDDESLRIIEITEENSLLPNHDNVMNVTNSVLISEIDSDTKWESIDLEENALPKVQELVRGTLSVQTIPLTMANCEKAKLLSSEEELSLRRYLQSLNLTTNPSTSLEIKTEIEQIINSEIKHRLRKKGSAEDGFSQRVGAPRTLDVIDEEASGESSIHSRRHSYLSDKKSENDDLEDDVFEQSCSRTTTNTSYNTQDKVLRKISSREQIPQKCVLVGAKLKDPEISEARGDWSIQTVEKMAGAEVVYLTDSSSSTSSLYDVCEDTGNEQDADVTIRIITPTIEVTDTENLLKKTFIPDNEVINNTRTVKCNTITDFSSENFVESSSNNYDSNNTFSNTEATLHEVVVLTTDNIKTNLIVKDIDGNKMTSDGTKVDDNLPYDTHVLSEINENKPSRSQYANDYDLEMKVLKCELNDAINNLIREVSDSENVNEISKETFVRRDSSSSISSSQCTAIYNPNSSLIDISHNDDLSQFGNNSKEILSSLEASSHVNDVIESVIKNSFTNESNLYNEIKQPQKLRDMCVQRISTFPYGEKILEELANVSLRLQNMNTFEFDSKEELKHGKIKRKDVMQNTSDQLKISYYRKPNSTENLEQRKSEESCNITKVSPPIPPPPPVPRNSSLKKSKDVNTNFDTSTEEKPYVCLSPSQKMLMEKTKTVFNKEDVTQTELSKKNYNFLKSVQPEKNTLKSETGSRLMALICDPAFTSNINSSLNKLSDEKLLSKNKTEIKPFNSSVKYNDPLLKRSSNSLKPVPPPRPTKLWSSFYESDENSDFHENSFKSLKKEKKTFHFSTGNLSKEIEDDITNIQNMHRNYIKVRNQTDDLNRPRRPSLPKDLCDQQMEYIRKKEKEVEAEIWRLERENSRAPIRKGPRAPMIKETDTINETVDITNQKSSKGMLWNTLLGSKSKKEQNSSIFSSSQEELLREKMYSEYLNEIAEREQRKYHKVIKITNTSLPSNSKFISKSMSALDILDSKVNNRIEEEFISKAKERWNKLGIRDPESEDESKKKIYIYKEPKTIEHKIKVIEAGEEKDVHRLPNHLQEFVSFTAKDKQEESGYTETVMIAPTFKARSTSPAVWRPGAPPAPGGSPSAAPSPSAPPPPPPPPIWTPNASPQAPRKTFRPVHFEDTPPTHNKFANAEQNGCMSGSETEGRLRTSQSAPATGLSALGGTITSRLPKAQNPTVTLLQKARENQTSYSSNIHEKDPRLPRDRPSPPLGDPVHALRKGYLSEGEGDRREHVHGGNHKMDDVNRKVEGIGPTTKEGMPVALRSEVKDPSRWYKKMYDTIHKNKYDDDYVTIRYKNRQGQPPLRVSSSKSQYAYFDPRSGYLSEPEGGLGRLGSSTWSDAYDSDATAGPRRRTASVQEDRRDEFLSPHLPNNKYSTLASARASQEVYKNQPGRIENYVPGKSSVIDKEAKQWWDEVMDIFDGQNISSTTSLPQTSPKSPKEKKDVTTTILSKSNMARALKESGYESDSTLIFRRREENEAPLSPAERRAAYKDLQAGGEPPLRGFRSPAPPRQDESEIEYIPISSTLTKIRVHKKPPQIHEVICYPMTKIQTNKLNKSSDELKEPEVINDFPPAPPRRISSKNSRTLKLVTSTKHSSPTPSRIVEEQSNIKFLKNKLSNKLNRQNTHVIIKKDTKTGHSKLPRDQDILNFPSTSSIPTKCIVKKGTSSFSSPRRTLPPTEYTSKNKYGEGHTSVIIESGAGRKTPISNILDKVTPLDKLWSSQKRNEQIDNTKHKEKSSNKSPTLVYMKSNFGKITSSTDNKSFSRNITHKSRDMIRTSEKLQKFKTSNVQHKHNSVSNSKNGSVKSPKLSTLHDTSNISKSTSNIPSSTKRQNSVRTAVVTNLKKKKSLEYIVVRPKSVPCHETCNKKTKGVILKKEAKPKSHKKNITPTVPNLEFHEKFDNTLTNPFDNESFGDLTCKQVNLKELKNTRDTIISDTFFRHLFLGNKFIPVSSTLKEYAINTVQQKAKLFQTLPQVIHNTSNYYNSYLTHRKPVSLSRFKVWDKSSPTRVSSPRSVSWPGKMNGEIKKFQSLSKSGVFGSVSSLSTNRSKSEPPTNKIYFSQTSRPVSPTVVFYKKVNTERKSESPLKIVHLQPKLTMQKNRENVKCLKTNVSCSLSKVDPVLPRNTQKLIKNIETQDIDGPATIFFSQTSRPVSPKIIKSTTSKSRSQSTSPGPFRSPSCRRIHSARLQSKQTSNNPSFKNELRTRSADNYKKLKDYEMSLLKVKSDSSLQVNDPDYDEYIQDLQNSKLRTERFRELNRYYTYLERVAELEKATSTCDLRSRKKDEEIIDFDRWKKIRAIERAEEELNNLYHKLKLAQSENSILFYPKDLNDFRWNSGKERGLRVKEKSVEDLKEELKQKSHVELNELNQSKDHYKPLWRGTSVAETAFNINKKNENNVKKYATPIKSTNFVQQDTTLSELQKKLGLGNRLWSSLSIEQVDALKRQLNAIYSKELEAKTNKENEKYTIEVKKSNSFTNPTLHVRCNSLTIPPTTSGHSHELSKSDSIAAIACSLASEKELKNNVNKMQMTLSEIEKKKISQSLSKEVLKRISNNDKFIQNVKNNYQHDKANNNECIAENINRMKKESVGEKGTPDSTLNSCVDEQKRHIVYATDNNETIYHSSTSETETGSSDNSNKTVIYNCPSKEVLKKVEYFESVNKITNYPINMYSAIDNALDNKNKADSSNLKKNNKPEREKSISQSQSCINFKELFGESEKNKFLSLPSKPDLYSRSPSPCSEVCISDRHTPDTPRCSSDEAIWHSRTPSPDPERYWRVYIKLARAGEVRRIARRFDSPSAAGAVLRRHRSDPEIARNVFNKEWSPVERIQSKKDKFKTMLPVVRVPLRPTNRFMPHIDVISKLATLRKRTSPRSRSAEETLECRSGEVERMRKRFEAISLLGPIYSSAPDVRNLHEIAPYLAGPWIAHRYPKPSDNTKSMEDSGTSISGRKSPIKKHIKQATSKKTVNLSSILKSELLGKQDFDPSVHRPVSRYEPPRAPPRPPPASWPYRLGPLVTPSRHTVSFQVENDSAPVPPRRIPQGSVSDTESPSRRYVESDVNIHYRCPVRHDPLPLVPERELARQQAEHMKRLYRDQKRNKYLQEKDIHLFDIEAFDASIKELQDMQNRRHQDNFMPSQKTVIPLNRYDEAEKLVARALYAFNGQTTRELSFKKGDLINVRRQIDSNWYEGEVHGRIGLFPYNYVEILKGDYVHSPKKPVVIEGQARAKFDFTAQTNLELPLKKGEVVILTRRIDHNWWEGRNGVKTGIFPDSYVTVLQEPSQSNAASAQTMSMTEKPAAAPAAHGLVNGAARRGLQRHNYTPQHNSPALSNAPPATAPLPGYIAKPAHSTLTPSERGYGPPSSASSDLNNAEPLYVDTNAEAIPYRAMYKYRPQNPDELELQEGDTVYVLEKCDDGWYVGSSQRTGRFGTFPGNYVERI